MNRNCLMLCLFATVVIGWTVFTAAAPWTHFSDFLLTLASTTAICGIWFAPWIVATLRRYPDTSAVAIYMWSGLLWPPLWGVALVLAFTGPTVKQ